MEIVHFLSRWQEGKSWEWAEKQIWDEFEILCLGLLWWGFAVSQANSKVQNTFFPRRCQDVWENKS